MPDLEPRENPKGLLAMRLWVQSTERAHDRSLSIDHVRHAVCQPEETEGAVGARDLLVCIRDQGEVERVPVPEREVGRLVLRAHAQHDGALRTECVDVVAEGTRLPRASGG